MTAVGVISKIQNFHLGSDQKQRKDAISGEQKMLETVGKRLELLKLEGLESSQAEIVKQLSPEKRMCVRSKSILV